MEENKNKDGQNKENASNNPKNVPPDQKIEGRLYGSKDPEFKKYDPKDDISHIDQQEGYMNPGTTGMNAPDQGNRKNEK